MSNETHSSSPVLFIHLLSFPFLSFPTSLQSSLPHLLRPPSPSLPSPSLLPLPPPPLPTSPSMHPLVIIFLLLAFTLWIGWVLRAVRRFLKFWEIRKFYHEALNVPSSQLRNCTWGDVLERLKEAQKEYKMNIQKQELTELDVYHRILRFTNYMVAMVNKTVLPCKFNVPFYGEKVFFTTGLRFNYELILFCKSPSCTTLPLKSSPPQHFDHLHCANMGGRPGRSLLMWLCHV